MDDEIDLYEDDDIDPEPDEGPDESYDGLRLCEVCQDRETTGDICHVCRQQKWIDENG